MVTNEERRAVAARIRELRKHAWDESSVFDLLGCAVEECGLDDTDQLFARLADLIEPEPERTCRMRDAHWDDGRRTWGCICSECGAKHERKSGKWMNYCPNCGAKVVEK